MIGAGMNRRLAAIVAADVAGYSRMTACDEEGTLAAMLSHRTELIDPAVAGYGGRIANTAGDSILIEFPSVVEAVRCCIDIQRGLAERNASVPEERRVTYRIGINLGDIVEQGGDLLGDGVNIAARLEGLSQPGGICLSRAARDQVRDRLEIALEEIGEVEVRNIPRPVRVWRWTGDKMRAEPDVVLPTRLQQPDKPSIAVLPFVNMSGDPEQEYFADGVAEDLTISLSNLPQLFVIARNSSFTYKGKSRMAQEIADELGVRYVVEGSVRKAGTRVRISAQLIDCSTGGHLWADRFDRELTDIFAIQDEVTQEIVTAMALKLSADDQQKVTHKITDNAEAYDYFLRGREQHWLLSREASAKAKMMLKQAINLDPSCAPAHASLSNSYLISYINEWDPTPDHSLAEATELAKKAVRLDPTYPDGHCALAHAELWNKQHDLSIAEYRKALALNPSHANASVSLGRAFIYSGRPDEAIESVERGLRLDPHYHDIHLHILAQAYFQLGRYEEAVEFLRRRLIRKPETDISRILLAACYGHLGRTEEATSVWREALRINPNYSLEHRRRILPFKNEEDFNRLVEGLSKAGLPN